MGKITLIHRSTTPTLVCSSGTLSGLADTNRQDSSANQTNTTEGDLYARVMFTWANTTGASTAGGTADLYLIPSLDDSAFAKGTTAIAPAGADLVWTYEAASSGGNLISGQIGLPPNDFKWILENNFGVKLSTGTNTLKAIYYTETVSS